jgi:hypothetical protein
VKHKLPENAMSMTHQTLRLIRCSIPYLIFKPIVAVSHYYPASFLMNKRLYLCNVSLYDYKSGEINLLFNVFPQTISKNMSNFENENSMLWI